jgi:adenosine deaminase
MLDAGLNVIAASDDPGMFPTSLNQEYEILASLDVPRERLKQMALAGVDASWLPSGQKAALRGRFLSELESVPGTGA